VVRTSGRSPRRRRAGADRGDTRRDKGDRPTIQHVLDAEQRLAPPARRPLGRRDTRGGNARWVAQNHGPSAEHRCRSCRKRWGASTRPMVPCISPSCTASRHRRGSRIARPRDGDPKSLVFYLDHGHVHVGDLAETTEDAFHAWLSDRAAGLDAIMIAPPASLSPNSTVAQERLILITPFRRRGGFGRRESGQCRGCDHHPQQRPPTPPHRHRLGQKRRSDHHPRR
jgi:hypothetical protein